MVVQLFAVLCGVYKHTKSSVESLENSGKISSRECRLSVALPGWGGRGPSSSLLFNGFRVLSSKQVTAGE